METLLQLALAGAARWTKLCELCSFVSTGKTVPKNVEEIFKELMPLNQPLKLLDGYCPGNSRLYICRRPMEPPGDGDYWEVDAWYWDSGAGVFRSSTTAHKRLTTALRAMRRVLDKVDRHLRQRRPK